MSTVIEEYNNDYLINALYKLEAYTKVYAEEHLLKYDKEMSYDGWEYDASNGDMCIKLKFSDHSEEDISKRMGSTIWRTLREIINGFS